MTAIDPRTSPEVVQALLHGGAETSTNPATRFVQVMLSGFGYNFHDAKNVARANDQLIRQRANALLAEAAGALGRVEGDFRDAYVPPSTREQPFPPADVMAALKLAEKLRHRVEELASSVLTLEAPGGDKLWARLRSEKELLERLLAVDIGVVVKAHDVLDAAKTINAESVKGRQLAPVEELLAPFEQVLTDRRALFSIVL
jgi:hypothetical protein